MWGWIKKWFDPITTSKIFILGANDVKPTLSAFIDVANIPKKYGGELDFECGMLPVLDPAVLRVLTLSSPDQASAAPMFFAAPVRWVDGEDGDLIALGVGSIDGQPRRETLGTLHSHVVQSAFPGMSRQNTRNIIEPLASKDVSDRLAASTAAAAPAMDELAPPTVPARSDPVRPDGNAAQAGPASAASLQAGPVTEANVPATLQPPPADVQPAVVTNGIGHAVPGPISLPPQPGPGPIQRSGSEYFTPAMDTTEVKRL